MDRYGDNNLAVGDRDTSPRGPIWAGLPGQQTESTGYVLRLQQDLRELGFRIVTKPDGIFDLHTEWSVREFQIYARMNNVARENVDPAVARRPYLERLTQVATGPNRYTGPVSGVVNRDTRIAIQQWLDNHWRCPVVVQARAGDRHADVFQGHDNIWVHDDVKAKAPRMFARDFTGYYTLPEGRDSTSVITVGDHASYLQWSGPRSIPPGHTWPDAELLPEHLTGTEKARLSTAQLSTYKVVRSVAEVECIGFFDSVNCYDNAFVSLGPCHWTLGIINGNQVDKGELGGFLSFLRETDPDAFEQAVGFFGMQIAEDWDGDGEQLRVSSARKYVGWPAQQREDGTYAPMPKDEAHGNYFKTWHWMYRFVMAGRTIEGYRRRMWDMARIRIRDIRDVAWNDVQPVVANARGRVATIGDVFTSERAMGVILRWHIRSPGSMVSAGPGARLRGALTRAQRLEPNLNWKDDPSGWSDAHETALVKGLMEEAEALAPNYFDTLNYVNKWPESWSDNPRRFALSRDMGRLSSTRGSLRFDDSGLPPAPAWDGQRTRFREARNAS